MFRSLSVKGLGQVSLRDKNGSCQGFNKSI